MWVIASVVGAPCGPADDDRQEGYPSPRGRCEGTSSRCPVARRSGPGSWRAPARVRLGPGSATAEASARALGEVGVDGVEVRLDVRITGEAAHDAARARSALQHRRGEALAARQRPDQGRREARARAVRTVAVAAHALVPAVTLAHGSRVVRGRVRPRPGRTVRRRKRRGTVVHGSAGRTY